MFEPWVVPLSALIVSVAALLLTGLTMRHSASSEYVRSLEARIERLERELTDTKRQLADARDENASLYQRLFKASGGRRHLPADGEAE